MNPILEIHDLQVQRAGLAILDIQHLTLVDGEVLAVIGPNGAGKSTMLLAIARLIELYQGSIEFRGQPLETQGELAYRRRLGLVLQDPLLLDTTVFNNVATGLRYRRLPRPQVSKRVEEWLGRLGIAHLSSRPARKLSGGEAQRVALARALVLQPELLLLDEPFSALDAPTRAHLLDDLQSLLATTRLTTIFITHDQDEAMQLGHRVAVLLAGRLRQVGPPLQVFNAPADRDVAAFVGMETVIPAMVEESSHGRVVIDADGMSLEVVGELPVGSPVLFCLRPEDVTLWPAGSPPSSTAQNCLKGTIKRMTSQGPLMRVVLDCGFTLIALITRASSGEMGLKEGSQVTAAFKASSIHLILR